MEPEISYPPDLPITERRDDLLAAISANQVVVVAGETGSGKSTQLPKLCLELGRGRRDEATGNGGLIGHTQPRRIAARSIAERVAEELGGANADGEQAGSVGGLVGYKVRFNDEVGPDTRIKVMTDGILLAEIQRDRTLRRYDTIIIDEAHERSLNIDFLLGYLRQLLPRRPDLKIIITSATIDTERFSKHFDDAPIIEVEGRTYPVDVRYRPLGDESSGDDDTNDTPPPMDQVDGICAAVEELRRTEEGDILVFCSGEREIRDAAAALEDLNLPDTEIFPLFARLSAAEQHRVFERHTRRRIVLATNVAETSLTVPGIRSVIDPGTARISRYSFRTKVQRLPIEAVSQASANQRAGRCGRVGPGVCIRLYSEDDFASRPEFTEPEIRRTNLASVILQMASLRLGAVESFPFVDPPADRNIRDGVALLEELGAVDPDHAETKKWLTPMGRQLAGMPVDPRLGRMVVEAATNGCLHEVMVITSGLSLQDPRERPFEKRAAADQSHARFAHPQSDFLSYVNLWNYIAEQRKERSSNQFRKMCRQEFLNYNRVREWQDIYTQLRRATKSLGFKPNTIPAEPDPIHMALLSGLLSQIGVKDTTKSPGREPAAGSGRNNDRRPPNRSREYLGARQARFAIAPGSALFKNPPNWVMAGELVETNRLYARVICRIDPLWVERLGGHLTKTSYGETTWDPERGTAMTDERVTIYGLTIVPKRSLALRRVDPALARELFIHHALVEGDWEATYPYIEHNLAMMAEAETVGARARRSDLIVEQQAIFDFYDQRLPDHITAASEFNTWWKKQRQRDATVLDMALTDVLADHHEEALDTDAFPEVWHYDGIDLPLTYEFDGGSEFDGVTVNVDAAVLGQLDPSRFEWNVPGFRDELADALIRSLPKTLRKLFVPVPETVREIRDGLDPAAGGVVESVRRELNKLLTGPLPVAAFDLDRVPAHLRPTFRVLDTDGETLATGKDLAALAKELSTEVSAIVATVDHDLVRHGLRTWSFGDLPTVVESQQSGRTVKGYPALDDEGDAAGIRLCSGPDEQAEVHWSGTRRLVRLAMPAPARQVDSLLSGSTKAAISDGRWQTKVEWYNDIIGAALDHLIAEAGGPVWTEAGFDRLVAAVRDRFGEILAAVASTASSMVSTLVTVQRQLATITTPAFQPAVVDVRAHLERLIYPGFVGGVGFERLDDIDRYLRAIERRLINLPNNHGRDTELMGRCQRLEVEFDDLVATVTPSAAVEELAWMLEEFRVSSFAQQLRTPVPVSEKRIRTEMSRIARGL